MKKIKIVADSSADISELKKIDFAYAPMKVITAEKEFVDDASLDVADMVQYLEKYKGKSKSSCPNASDWLEAFGDAEEIFCVTITSGLSGSYNSACAAKQLYESEHPERRVFVVDSLSAGPEIRLIIEALESMIGAEIPYEEICQRITEYRSRTGLYFMLKSLRNFANNGRVSPTVAKIVGFIGICIVGKASDAGTLEPVHKCRGEAKSLEKLVSDLEAAGYAGGKVRITHCFNEAAAIRLRELVLAKFPNADVAIAQPMGLCSFYMENGGVLVGFEKESADL